MPSTTRITSVALLIYLPLAAIALVWARLGQDRWAWALSEPSVDAGYAARLVISLGLGLALAVVVVASTPRLVERAAWARALHDELKPIIAPLTQGEVVLLALLSGFSEELFFRGAMQPVLGLFVTSVIFGAVHTGPKRVFWVWSAWAFAMGLLFGLIFELTGILWGPVLGHALINQRNMAFMKGH